MHSTNANKLSGERRRKLKTAVPIPKWCTDMTILSQVLNTYAYESIIYATILLAKEHPLAGYLAAKHQKHSKSSVSNIREKPTNLLVVTLGPAITLRL